MTGRLPKPSVIVTADEYQRFNREAASKKQAISECLRDKLKLPPLGRKQKWTRINLRKVKK